MNITEALLEQSKLKAEISELKSLIFLNNTREVLDGVVIQEPEYEIDQLLSDYSAKLGLLANLKFRIARTNIVTVDKASGLTLHELLLKVQELAQTIDIYSNLVNVAPDPYGDRCRRTKDQSYSVPVFDKKQFRLDLKALQDRLGSLNAQITGINYNSNLV